MAHHGGRLLNHGVCAEINQFLDAFHEAPKLAPVCCGQTGGPKGQRQTKQIQPGTAYLDAGHDYLYGLTVVPRCLRVCRLSVVLIGRYFCRG